MQSTGTEVIDLFNLPRWERGVAFPLVPLPCTSTPVRLCCTSPALACRTATTGNVFNRAQHAKSAGKDSLKSSVHYHQLSLSYTLPIPVQCKPSPPPESVSFTLIFRHSLSPLKVIESIQFVPHPPPSPATNPQLLPKSDLRGLEGRTIAQHSLPGVPGTSFCADLSLIYLSLDNAMCRTGLSTGSSLY